jgi:peptidoglycan/xylan/chitin deacetylase (PgdA/CDA1 family)
VQGVPLEERVGWSIRTTAATLAVGTTVVLSLAASGRGPLSAQTSALPAFAWPAGTRAAVSLSFDDGRASQLDVGVPLFAERGTHVTFYLTASNIGDRAADWRKAAAAGHELANHTATHPCSGNFPWARARALEDYTLDRIRGEMLDANRLIAAVTGVTPVTFAYPCGQKFVGRGAGVTSYVPVVAELFLAGRGWLDEAPNDPALADRAQLFGFAVDDMEFSELRSAVDDALARGQWLVLAGHDIGEQHGRQVTRVSMLRELVAYLREPSRGVWLDTVARVAEHIRREERRVAAGPVPAARPASNSLLYPCTHLIGHGSRVPASKFGSAVWTRDSVWRGFRSIRPCFGIPT